MKEYEGEDLAGFIQDYFGEWIIIEGESINVQENFSSQELIRYAKSQLKEEGLRLEEKAILSDLIDKEIRRVCLVRDLLHDVILTLRQK